MNIKTPALMTLALLTAIAPMPFAAAVLIADSLRAQAPAAAPIFPLPASLPSDAVVKVAGSSSMTAISQALKQGFERKFTGAKVETVTNDADAALKAVLAGKQDVAAIGRPLLDAEIAQGLTPMVVSREKIAIVVGAANPFAKSLTGQQFAQMFRGEITNWAQVGGPSGKIRVVDRPATSDTRQSFRTYPMFKAAAFTAGMGTKALAEDSTEAMVKALGKDGIGYANYSQVKDRKDVKIIAMHQTWPEDARYPFSQPRLYAYGKNPSAATQAFLGFAGAPAGQQLVTTAQTAAGSAKAAVAPLNAPSPSPNATNPVAALPETAKKPTETAKSSRPEGQTAAKRAGDTNSAAPNNQSGLGDKANLTIAPPAEAKEGGLPGWLLPVAALLGGGGLLWLLGKNRGRGGAAVADAPLPVPPVPMKFTSPRLVQAMDNAATVTDEQTTRLGGAIDPATATTAATALAGGGGVAASRREPEEAIAARPTGASPNLAPDVTGTGTPVVGGLTQTGGAAIAGGAVLAGGAAAAATGLFARSREAAGPGVAGVTDSAATIKAKAMDTPPPMMSAATANLATGPTSGVTNRFDDVKLASGAALAGGAAIAGAATASSRINRSGSTAGDTWLDDHTGGTLSGTPQYGESRIFLAPHEGGAYAYWNIPSEDKEVLRRQGGTLLALRLYDVTDIDLSYQTPHSMQQYECGEMSRDQYLPVLLSDRDYIVDIGYTTADGRWLLLSRSTHTRLSFR